MIRNYRFFSWKYKESSDGAWCSLCWTYSCNPKKPLTGLWIIIEFVHVQNSMRKSCNDEVPIFQIHPLSIQLVIERFWLELTTRKPAENRWNEINKKKFWSFFFFRHCCLFWFCRRGLTCCFLFLLSFGSLGSELSLSNCSTPPVSVSNSGVFGLPSGA